MVSYHEKPARILSGNILSTAAWNRYFVVITFIGTKFEELDQLAEQGFVSAFAVLVDIYTIEPDEPRIPNQSSSWAYLSARPLRSAQECPFT